MGIEQWSPTAADNVSAKTGINWDEGMAPSAVNDSARSTMADIKEWHIDAEWLKLGENGSANAYSISFVSTTVFKFVGTDRRTLAPVHRRVKAGVGAGVIYGTISDSSLSASDTQITVAWDSGQLDASLSFVSLGIISPSNTSHPSDMDMSFSDVAIKGALSFASGATITGNPDASLSDISVVGRALNLTKLLGKSGAAVSGAADTNENTLATITVPANSMGANGFIRFIANFTVTSNANAKTLKLKIGGTTVGSYNLAGIANANLQGSIANANATNSQVAFSFTVHPSVGGGTTQYGSTAAIDTTSATTITITAQKGTSGDTFTMNNYLFELVSDGA